jgi:hypothetical protein
VNGLGDVLAARDKVIAAVLDTLSAERKLSGNTASVPDVTRCETAVDLAALALVNAIDELPLAQRPKGWPAE